MLAWERWTVTHSSGGAEVLVLPLLLGLAATMASSVDPDGDDAVTWLGPALTLVAGGAEVGASLAAVELLADGLGEGEGEGEGEGDGEGDGVGVPDEGRAWHAVSVFVADAASAACALPSAPKVMKLALSKVVAASRTCAKRMRFACLRCSSGHGRLWDGIGTDYSSPHNRLHMHHQPSGSQRCARPRDPHVYEEKRAGRAPSNRGGAGRSVRPRRECGDRFGSGEDEGRELFRLAAILTPPEERHPVLTFVGPRSFRTARSCSRVPRTCPVRT
jgi:hypothetical protein